VIYVYGNYIQNEATIDRKIEPKTYESLTMLHRYIDMINLHRSPVQQTSEQSIFIATACYHRSQTLFTASLIT
jgi:molybdopterin synthase catalytic subunit